MNKLVRLGILTVVAASLAWGSPAALAKEKGGGEKKGWEGDTPPGWGQGEKKGWGESEMPPGLAKKTGEASEKKAKGKKEHKGKEHKGKEKEHKGKGKKK